MSETCEFYLDGRGQPTVRPSGQNVEGRQEVMVPKTRWIKIVFGDFETIDHVLELTILVHEETSDILPARWKICTVEIVSDAHHGLLNNCRISRPFHNGVELDYLFLSFDHPFCERALPLGVGHMWHPMASSS